MRSTTTGAARQRAYRRLRAYRYTLKSWLLALSVVLKGEPAQLELVSLQSLQQVARYYRLKGRRRGKKDYFRWLQQKLRGVQITVDFIPQDPTHANDFNARPERAEPVPLNRIIGKAVLKGTLSAQDSIDWWRVANGGRQTQIQCGQQGIYWFRVMQKRGFFAARWRPKALRFDAYRSHG